MKLQKNNKPVKIKDSKEFDIKFNNFMKVLFVTATTIVLSTTAITLVISNKVKPTNQKSTISKEYNNFDKHIKNENGVTYYKGENVRIAIDKHTLESKQYIVDSKTNKSGEMKEFNMYELETRELISYYSKKGILLKIYGMGYSNYLTENCNFYELEEMTLENLKEWYTIEEIKELETKFLETKKENNTQKIKTLK